MRLRRILLLLALFPGCTHATRAGAVGGMPAWEIDCPGGDRSECHAKAREVCDGQYETVSGSSRATVVQDGMYGNQVGYRHRITVVCLR